MKKIHRKLAETFYYFGVAVAVVASGVLSVLIAPAPAANAAPFVCGVTQGFATFTQYGPTRNQLTYANLDQQGQPVFVNIGGTVPQAYNALGYNPVDNYMYAIGKTNDGLNNDELLRIEHDGSAVSLGLVPGLPAAFWQTGGMDSNNNLYIMRSGASNVMYRIDVTTNTATAITLSQASYLGDIVWLDGYLWGFEASVTGSTAVRINPATGELTKFAQTAVPATTDAAQQWMGIWGYGDGSFGLIQTLSGVYARVKINNPASSTPTFERIAISTGEVAPNGDATSCISAPTDLGITSTAPATVAPGTNFNVEYTVTNNGPSASSGVVVKQTLPSEFSNYTTTTPGCTIIGNELQCILGAFGIGESASIVITTTAGPIAGVCGVNRAAIFGNEADSNPANDTTSVTTCVAALTAEPIDNPVAPTQPVLAETGDSVNLLVVGAVLGLGFAGLLGRKLL